jgi:hypothetical protein
MPSGDAFVKCRSALESIVCGYARRGGDLCVHGEVWFIAAKAPAPRRAAKSLLDPSANPSVR